MPLTKKYPIPTQAEKQLIKADLRIRGNDPLPKCMAQSSIRRMEFEAAGDMSHSGAGHVCNDCRCKNTAGKYTGHYGLGYCWDHENSARYSGKRDVVVEKQRIAIQQGLPDDPVKYRSNSKHLKRMKAEADAAGGRMDLCDELLLLRANLQEMMEAFEKGKDGLTEGTGRDGEAIPMSDKTYFTLIAKLAGTIGSLSKQNLEITDGHYVHIDQLKVWFAQVYAIIERTVIDDAMREELWDEIKMIPTPRRGRK